MGPQSFDCGSRDAKCGGLFPDRASMGGRSLSTAEVPWCSALGIAVLELQWGRSLSTAEVKGAARSDGCRNGFNGAAVFRLRKLRFLRDARAASRLASMGPQSFDCGSWAS